jgi:hypothetical protein
VMALLGVVCPRLTGCAAVVIRDHIISAMPA